MNAAEEADPPLSPLLLEAAELYAEDLIDLDRAKELYFSALERSEHDIESARTAGQALERLLESQNRPAERCMVLERLAELAKGPKELQTTLIEAGRLALEELSDPDRAVRNYRRLLEHQPSDSTALGGLVQALYAPADRRSSATRSRCARG